MITVTRSFDPEGGYEFNLSGITHRFFTLQAMQDYFEEVHPGEPVQWNITNEEN